jgi:prevent-host-death family protein
MACTARKSGVKEVPLCEIKDDLSRYLREAEEQEIVITRHGKPAGALIGFQTEDRLANGRGLVRLPYRT